MKRKDIDKAAHLHAEKYSADAYKLGPIGAFIAGVEWFMKSLFHKTKDEVPQPIGDYANEVYPQIPCLVKGHLSTGYGYGVRFRHPERISSGIKQKGSQPTRLEANSPTRLMMQI